MFEAVVNKHRLLLWGVGVFAAVLIGSAAGAQSKSDMPPLGKADIAEIIDSILTLSLIHI